MSAALEGGSYRDPAGRVHVAGERVLRTVMPVAADDYAFVRSTRFYARESAAGRIVGETPVDPKDWNALLGDGAAGACHVVEHPKLRSSRIRTSGRSRH